MHKIFFLSYMLLCSLSAAAQKTIYIPYEWLHPWPQDSLLYAESDPDNKYTWSKSRSVESDNVIVFWDKGYGSKLPSKSPAAYSVDEQDLLRKCEEFYNLEINQLGFVNPETSNLAKYKVMVLLNHTTDWVCYGGGYDFMVSALWLGPSACKPVGHSVAHEVGHSFHYMCFAEDNNHQDSRTNGTGFHLPIGNGAGVWEQTAQWQANQSYPEYMFSQSIGVFRDSHNYAFSHEWHRYQSYWFFYYLTQKLNDIKAVANVWNYHVDGVHDFNEVLMKQQGWSAEDLYRHYYEYAARCATWDFDAAAPYRDASIGSFTYRAVQTGDHAYQVAMASVPQSTGFNIIPLQVPEAGQTVKATFTALRPTGTRLADDDPKEYLNGETQWTRTDRTTYFSSGTDTDKGFRLGYVALLNDGTRVYLHNDEVYCQGRGNRTAEVEAVVPEGTQRLWMVVSPAPSKYYRHLWDEDYFTQDDAWPYTVSFEGTDIADNANVTTYSHIELDGRPIQDAEIAYDVYFPASSQSFDGAAVNVKGVAAATLGTAFQMQPSDINGLMASWTARAQPNTINLCAATATGLQGIGSTANGYGHWFDTSGKAVQYSNSTHALYSEFYPYTLSFIIGQEPGKLANGQNYVIRQALRYRNDATTATVRFVFNIHLTANRTEAQLRSVTYTNADGITQTTSSPTDDNNKGIFDLSGRRLNGTQLPAGLYIHNGRKVIIR